MKKLNSFYIIYYGAFTIRVTLIFIFNTFTINSVIKSFQIKKGAIPIAP